MAGLDSLDAIGGTLNIFLNSKLKSLEGLEGLESIDDDLFLYYNFKLKDCCAIYDLLNNGGIEGITVIFFNSSTCNSIGAINADCSGSSIIAPPVAGINAASIERTSGDQFIDVNLFPNPAEDFFNISISGKYEQGRVKIFGTTGKLLLENEWQSNNIVEKISIKNWKPGVYFTQVILDGKTITKKLVIQ